MSKVKLITSETCTKCHFIKAPLKARAEKNGYEFTEKDISTAAKEEIGEATSLPIIYIDDEQYDYDNILTKIS